MKRRRRFQYCIVDRLMLIGDREVFHADRNSKARVAMEADPKIAAIGPVLPKLTPRLYEHLLELVQPIAVGAALEHLAKSYLAARGAIGSSRKLLPVKIFGDADTANIGWSRDTDELVACEAMLRAARSGELRVCELGAGRTEPGAGAGAPWLARALALALTGRGEVWATDASNGLVVAGEAQFFGLKAMNSVSYLKLEAAVPGRFDLIFGRHLSPTSKEHIGKISLEVASILKPDGTAILEFDNRSSYPDAPNLVVLGKHQVTESIFRQWCKISRPALSTGAIDLNPPKGLWG